MKFPKNNRLSVVFGNVTSGMSHRTPFKLTKYLEATPPVHYTDTLRQRHTPIGMR